MSHLHSNSDSDRLQNIRHTLAHLMAAAVLEQYPHAKPTIGPAIDNGFYYDFDFSTPAGAAIADAKPTEKDLKDIEKTMRKLLPSWKEMSGKEVSADEARKAFAHNPFKLELIDEIVGKGEKITLYSAGSDKAPGGAFTDLCRGGHAVNPAQDIPADSFRLTRIAGAYWRGDENKPQPPPPVRPLPTGTSFAPPDTTSFPPIQAPQPNPPAASLPLHSTKTFSMNTFTTPNCAGTATNVWTNNGQCRCAHLGPYIGPI